MSKDTSTTLRTAEAPTPALARRGAERVDIAFRYVTMAFGLVVVGLIVWIGLQLYAQSALSRERFGFALLTRSTWDVNRGIYGALPYIFGTIVTSTLALLLAVPVGVGSALFLTELAPRWLATPLAFLIELLAAIPSVIFGLWGFNVMCPWMDEHLNPWLTANFGALPLFGGPAQMTSMLAAGFILAIMILPFITSVSREVIRTVPAAQREASLGLGATRWETTRSVVLKSARSGIIGAIILGLGRAIGETMAVVMVIGNLRQISWSILKAGYTMPAVLANEFNEAQNIPLQRSALIEVALTLFVITLVINALARLLILLTSRNQAPGGQASQEPRWLEIARDVLGPAARYAVIAVVGVAAVYQVASDVRTYGARAAGAPAEMVLIAFLAVRGLTALARRVSMRPGAAGLKKPGPLVLDWNRWRKLNNLFMSAVVGSCAVAACCVLGLLLYFVSVKGIKALSPTFFTNAQIDPVPGFKNGIAGTLTLVGIAACVGVPVGLLGGIFLAEFHTSRLTPYVRFAADVLNGIPSIVIGMFAYTVLVLPVRHFSALAGGLALGIMMVPTIVRTTEEMLRLVPGALREASLGLGATRLRTMRSVVLPAARSGVVTGIMLATARIAGETAPLIFTAFGNVAVSTKLSEPISSMTIMVYQYAIQPFDEQVNQAWTGALVLLLLVLAISVAARLLTRSKYALR